MSKKKKGPVTKKPTQEFIFQRKNYLWMFVGIALFCLVYFGPDFPDAVDPDQKTFDLTHQGKAALGLFLLAATWWVFEVVPIGVTSIAIAVFGFLVWGHHMFTSGQSSLANMIFSALTFSVAIPSAVKVFNWLATMYKGSIQLAAPMLYALSFLFLFAIGGLTGLFLGALATDIHLHDTYFIVAHFHYVMFGGTVIAFIGGIHYWWPKMFGRMYSQPWAMTSAIVTPTECTSACDRYSSRVSLIFLSPLSFAGHLWLCPRLGTAPPR